MIQKSPAPEFWSGQRKDEQIRKIAQVANQLQKGQGNNAFSVTLAVTPATSTEVLVTFAKVDHVPLLSPQNALAATDFATGTTFAAAEEGKVTITHAASSDSRVYGVVLFG